MDCNGLLCPRENQGKYFETWCSKKWPETELWIYCNFTALLSTTPIPINFTVTQTFNFVLLSFRNLPYEDIIRVHLGMKIKQKGKPYQQVVNCLNRKTKDYYSTFTLWTRNMKYTWPPSTTIYLLIFFGRAYIPRSRPSGSPNIIGT